MPPLEIIRHLTTYLPRQLWLLRLIKKTSGLSCRDQRIVLILSSDTEFDPAGPNVSWRKRSTKDLLNGLPNFLHICEDHDAPATLFSEGQLVQELPELFREISKRHEIGCHSLAHEWLGTRPPPRWVPQRNEFSVLSNTAKSTILREAVEAIQGVVGIRPEAFKAPFNSVDDPSTLVVLDRVGFRTDSSLPAYGNQSLFRSFRPVSTRHLSSSDLWSEGDLRIIEVPFMIRPRPILLHPYEVREEIVDTVSRGMKLALEAVDVQCRIDRSMGRNISVFHVTSHPWEFSNATKKGYGEINAARLTTFLDKLTGLYDVTFHTVTKFSREWEREYCSLHSDRENHETVR